MKWQVSTDGGTSFTDILGATSTTYTFTTSAALNGNEYRAVFTNTQGTLATTSALLNVLIAPAITNEPSNQATVAGSGVTFTAAATGNPTPTVQWQVSTNGGTTFANVAGATSKSYTFTSTSTENGYEYRAVFTNSQGTATTSAAVLTLHGSSLLLHNFGDLGPGGVEYQLAAGPNGTTFFETNDLMTGDVQLWISNGTPSGTTMLRDFGDLHNSGRLEVLQELGTSPHVTLIFESMDFTAKDLQVWASTGTVAGTVLLHNFGDLGPAGVLQTFEGTSNVPNTYALLEVVDSYANDTQLWGTNATPAGTALLHDFGNLGTTGGLMIQGFANTGSQIISSDDSTTGDTQLWATSGTSVAGTIQLHDFADLGDDTGYLSSITNAQNGTLLFQTDNATTGDNQLWTTSGTVAGTILLHDYGFNSRESRASVAPGNCSASASHLPGHFCIRPRTRFPGIYSFGTRTEPLLGRS